MSWGLCREGAVLAQGGAGRWEGQVSTEESAHRNNMPEIAKHGIPSLARSPGLLVL